VSARAFGATNEPGTCLWCGRKLNSTAKWPRYFDKRRCAQHFAVTMAQDGHRLKSWREAIEAMDDN
jgi:hypothetical protein